MQDNYDDIIHMEHPVSKSHPQMSMMARAAQFSPFAALTGYDASVRNEARRNEESYISVPPICASSDDYACDTLKQWNHN